MDAETDYQRVANKVQFWTMLGPLSILCILIVTLFKADLQYSLLSFITVAGLAVCWKWKMRGLIVTVVALVATMLLLYSHVALQDRYWLVGISMAIALGLVTTVLALEESEEMVSHLHVESSSRLENLWKLHEKLKQGQEHWQTERQSLINKVQELSKESAEKEALATRWEQAVLVVKRDVEASQAAQDRLLEELFERRTEITQLREQLEAKAEAVAEETEELPLDADLDRRYRQLEGMHKQLREQFENKSQLLDLTRQELFHAQEKQQALELEKQELALMAVHDCEVALQRHLELLEVENDTPSETQAVEIATLQDLVSTLASQLEEKAKNEHPDFRIDAGNFSPSDSMIIL